MTENDVRKRVLVRVARARVGDATVDDQPGLLSEVERRSGDQGPRLSDADPARQVAEALGAEDIYVWDGNYYALAVTTRLGLEESGGMVRVGPVHYNTIEEIERFGRALGRVVT